MLKNIRSMQEVTEKNDQAPKTSLMNSRLRPSRAILCEDPVFSKPDKIAQNAS